MNLETWSTHHIQVHTTHTGTQYIPHTGILHMVYIPHTGTHHIQVHTTRTGILHLVYTTHTSTHNTYRYITPGLHTTYMYISLGIDIGSYVMFAINLMFVMYVVYSEL